MIPNMIHRCDLDGHRWLECHGGKECGVCGQVNIRRDIILPGRIRLWAWLLSIRASLVFLAAAIVFCTFVYVRFYA